MDHAKPSWMYKYLLHPRATQSHIRPPHFCLYSSLLNIPVSSIQSECATDRPHARRCRRRWPTPMAGWHGGGPAPPRGREDVGFPLSCCPSLVFLLLFLVGFVFDQWWVSTWLPSLIFLLLFLADSGSTQWGVRPTARGAWPMEGRDCTSSDLLPTTAVFSFKNMMMT
jgi:hypothetical protein